MRTSRIIRTVAAFGVMSLVAVGCSSDSADTTAAPAETEAAAPETEAAAVETEAAAAAGAAVVSAAAASVSTAAAAVVSAAAASVSAGAASVSAGAAVVSAESLLQPTATRLTTPNAAMDRINLVVLMCSSGMGVWLMLRLVRLVL